MDLDIAGRVKVNQLGLVKEQHNLEWLTDDMLMLVIGSETSETD